jgi:hypothetical protein
MKKQKRVFAYHLAKTIENSDLKDISGGRSQMLTRQQTVKVTGNGVDVSYDISLDGDL